MKRFLGPLTLLTAAGLSLVLTTSADPAGAATTPSVVKVVAAENFWGNITSQLGGHDVSVTSLITNPNADPHLFESDAADAAHLAQAQVVVENGVNYDTFMHSLLGADGGHPIVVTAASVLHVTGADPNPHLWYDIPRVPAMAAAITAALIHAAPRDAATFRANLSTFDASLAPLTATLDTIRRLYAGAPVAYTERVPGYALTAAHLVVKTPVGFAKAIEDGVDPGPGDTVAMEQLITGGHIDVLLYNTQTVSSVTTQIRQLALSHHIPVVGVSETMPLTARSYQQWQLGQLEALRHALSEHRAHG
jgi:zinc/manganese transport system substrate-binding protein